MKFCEKLRLKRTQAHMTQEELAKRLGLAKRTVEGYESGAFSPRRRDVYALLAQIFATDPGYFVTDDENEVPAEELARQLIENAKALYSGGELSQKDKDALALALMEAYSIAKNKLEINDRK